MKGHPRTGERFALELFFTSVSLPSDPPFFRLRFSKQTPLVCEAFCSSKVAHQVRVIVALKVEGNL